MAIRRLFAAFVILLSCAAAGAAIVLHRRDPLLSLPRPEHDLAAEETAAANGEVEQSSDPPNGEGACEGLEFVEFAGKIAAADERADRRACNHADFDAFLVEGAQHADMRPAAGGATPKGNSDLRSLWGCRRFWWCC